MKNKEKIVIGWVDSGVVLSGFAYSISQILLHRNNIVQDVVHSSGAYLSANRNAIVKKFLNTEAEWLLTLDSDILVDLKSFDALVNFADKNKNPILGGKYFLPFNNGDQVSVSAMEFNEDGITGKWLTKLGNEPLITNLHSVGVGYALIHRSVFEKISELNPGHHLPWFSDGYVDLKEGYAWGSDDVYFMKLARKAGFNISLCNVAYSKHVKSILIDEAHWKLSNRGDSK